MIFLALISAINLILPLSGFLIRFYSMIRELLSQNKNSDVFALLIFKNRKYFN